MALFSWPGRRCAATQIFHAQRRVFQARRPSGVIVRSRHPYARKVRTVKHRTSLLLAGVLVLGLSGAGISRAATGPGTVAATPTSPATHLVTAGFGDRGGAANIFAPQVVEIYAGDTVTWTRGGALEPHTVSFGPQALLDKLAAGIIAPVPQQGGAPLMAFNSQAAFPTMSTTYDGTGFANSGILAGKGKTWSLTFTKPGAYRYYCLIHYMPGHPEQSMGGEVIVRARPAAGHAYVVSMGSAQDSQTNALDQFNPRKLTIHAGDSVTWIGAFHTVTFGPEDQVTQIEQHFIVPVTQKAGPPLLTINPKAASPAGGTTYDGTGFVSSGFLTPQGAKPATYTLTFTKPGMYSYDCLVHPGMDGTITVLA
jgi:plastocyanin